MLAAIGQSLPLLLQIAPLALGVRLLLAGGVRLALGRHAWRHPAAGLAALGLALFVAGADQLARGLL